jgi:hypothetical protein
MTVPDVVGAPGRCRTRRLPPAGAPDPGIAARRTFGRHDANPDYPPARRGRFPMPLLLDANPAALAGDQVLPWT